MQAIKMPILDSVKLLLLSIFLAFVTWKWIELPFRLQNNISKKIKLLSIFIASLLLMLAAGYGIISRGFLWNKEFEIKMKPAEDLYHPDYGLGIDCVKGNPINSLCTTSAEPEILVWGDSYAIHLIQPLLASSVNPKIAQATMSSCGPIMNIAPSSTKYASGWSKKCMQANDSAFEYLTKTPSLRRVVLSSPFNQYLDNDAKIINRQGFVSHNNNEVFKAFELTLKKIRSTGVEPIIISPPPRNGENIARCLEKNLALNHPLTNCNFKKTQDEKIQKEIYEFLRKIDINYSVIWLRDETCIHEECLASIDGVFIYFDSGHLSTKGGILLGKKMKLYNRILNS